MACDISVLNDSQQPDLSFLLKVSSVSLGLYPWDYACVIRKNFWSKKPDYE